MQDIANHQERYGIALDLERAADYLNDSFGTSIAKYEEIGVELTSVQKKRLRNAVNGVYIAFDQITSECDDLDDLADAQEDFEEILLTLWERMRAYSPADEAHSPCGVHYRLYEVLTALEDALLERDLIATEVIPTKG